MKVRHCALALTFAWAACGGGDPAHPELKPYPKSFLWGTATAPYQVEGHLHDSDWYQWESTPQNGLHASADDGPDEYDLFDGDFALAGGMGNNAARLGIDWSRLFPTAASFPSSPDPTALAHYHAVLASLKAHGLSPMVTLYHWVFPTWVQDLTDIDQKSGWLDPGSVQRFADFAGWAGREFGGEVDWWITLNEPTATMLLGYIQGTEPPNRSYTAADGILKAETAARNMIYAHAAAYDALHANDTVDADGDGKPAWVSMAFHQRYWEPATPSDQAATDQVHYLSNLLFLNAATRGDLDFDIDQKLDGPMDKAADPALQNRLDFIGLNYYGPGRVLDLQTSSIGPINGLPMLSNIDDDRPHTELRWSIDAARFRDVLDEAAAYHLPILVTENGLGDSTDAQRPRFLADHLYVLQKALQDGLDVRGYYHWSLVDNFEWASGYCPRFGLFHVDYASPQKTRTAGAGVDVYRQIIANRGVDPALFARYPDYPTPTMYCGN